MSRPEAQAERVSPEGQGEEPLVGFQHQRNVVYQERKGAHTFYPVTKEDLDVLLGGVRRMPSSSKFIQPLGWTLLGVAATAAVEAYNADRGSTHRHVFGVVAVCAALAGLVCLIADRAVRKSSQHYAGWCETYLLDMYEAFGIEPPPKRGLVGTYSTRRSEDGRGEGA